MIYRISKVFIVNKNSLTLEERDDQKNIWLEIQILNLWGQEK
jgi:hypothetical protein